MAGSAGNAPTWRSSFPAMGTRVDIIGWGGNGMAIVNAVVGVVARHEDMWSVFRPSSEVSRLNAAVHDAACGNGASRCQADSAQGGPGLVKESADIRASGVLGGEHNPAQRPGVVTENHAGDRDVPSLHRGKDGRGRGQRAAGRTQHLIPHQAPRALDGQQRAQQSLRQRSAARACHRTHPA